MLDAALKLLSDQAVKAYGPHIVNREAEPPHVYFVDGKRTVAEPPPRDHVAADLGAIIDFAKANPKASVWYSAAGVTCLVDDATRRDRVSLKLSLSRQLEKIMSWGDKSPPMKQRDFILMLRTMFKRNLAQAPNLIDSVRIVKFTASKQTDANIGSGKASIGTKIETEISGAGGIPDDFFFNVPIFGEPFGNIEGLIDVALEMDATSESFTIHPVPGTISKQIALAENVIGETLRKAIEDGGKSGPRVFYGSAQK